MSRPGFRPRTAYRRWHPIVTRWNDNDAYGHVNNAVYYIWYDSAVNAVLIETGLLDIANGDTRTFAVASECRYAFPLAYPEPVAIGLSLQAIGRSSLTWQLGAFRDGVAEAAAEGSFVQVCVDRATQRPVAVPQGWRERLDAFLSELPAEPENAAWT
ncbi:acyl-CoA thioesterase [Lichenicoccus roseus]|uniref:Acyl-CoA thioesterase n=1 Tax=Lichenicoccus roseus TaxID=2683649 RepID=A0A5R9J1B2_9PROT|nr:thioesterase family protein [Lichenicoccus roseus]TLU71332.1 acyl-CoA thioesterase [Lichenicoccus roseus]